jgi:hypothetical protein
MPRYGEAEDVRELLEEWEKQWDFCVGGKGGRGGIGFQLES